MYRKADGQEDGCHERLGFRLFWQGNRRVRPLYTSIQSEFPAMFQAVRSKTGGTEAAQCTSQGRGGLAAEPGRTGRAVHDHCDPSWCFVALAVTEQKGNQDANDFD